MCPVQHFEQSNMNLALSFIALLLGLTGSASAADQGRSPSLAELGHSFKNALTEEETRLVIGYMRDSVMAAFNDEEITLPADLAFKLQVLQQRLKKESNFYLDNFLTQLEQDIKRSLKEKMEPSPPVPYTTPELPFLQAAVPPPVAIPAPTPQPVASTPPVSFSPPPGAMRPGSICRTWFSPRYPWQFRETPARPDRGSPNHRNTRP